MDQRSSGTRPKDGRPNARASSDGAPSPALPPPGEFNKTAGKRRSVAFNTMIKECGKDYTRALGMLRRMAQEPEGADVFAVNACMNVCANAGKWSEAVELFQSMGRRGVAPTVITYNTAIRALGLGRQVDKALGLLDDMQSRHGLRPDVITYNSALAACAVSGRVDEALELLAAMARCGVQPDRVSFNSTLAATARVGDWQRARNLLRVGMAAAGVTPDVVSYGTVLSAMARAGQSNPAKELLESMAAESAIRPNARCYNAALLATVPGGEWEAALALLGSMEERALEGGAGNGIVGSGKGGNRSNRGNSNDTGAAQPDSYSVNAAISACARAGEAERAMGLLRGMQARFGVRPDVVSFTAALSGCARAGLWQHGLALLGEMEAQGVVPNVVTFNAAILCCANGKAPTAHASRLFEAMLTLGMAPDPYSFNALVRAYDRSGQPDAALQVRTHNVCHVWSAELMRGLEVTCARPILCSLHILLSFAPSLPRSASFALGRPWMRCGSAAWPPMRSRLRRPSVRAVGWGSGAEPWSCSKAWKGASASRPMSSPTTRP